MACTCCSLPIELLVSLKTYPRFLFASLQLEQVLSGETRKAMIKALNNMPEKISDFFGKTVSRLAKDGFARRALLWLTYAKEPLDFKALSHALSIELEDVELEDGMLDDIDRDNIPSIEVLVERCCGLTVIDDNNNLRLAHFSILEYLKSNPQVFEPLNELFIAKVCLRYLSLHVFESRCSDDQTGQRIQGYPLLQYAARRWRFHVSQDKQLVEVERAVLHLFSHEGLFNNYIEFYSFWLPTYGLRPERLNPPHQWAYRSPLYNAIELQLPEGIIRRLLETNGIPSNLGVGPTVLILAVRVNSKDFVDMLLEAGADPSMRSHVPEASEWSIFKDITYNHSERHAAIQEDEKSLDGQYYPSTLAFMLGYQDIFETLRHRVRDLDVMGDVLIKAVEEHGWEDMVETLLREYPAIDHQHPAYLQALRALKWERRDSERKLKILLEARPLLDDRDGVLTGLLPFVITRAPEFVKPLLDRGASPSIYDERPFTSLWAAIRMNYEKLARVLVDKGASISADVVGEAAAKGMNDLIIQMLDKGYDIRAQSCDVSVAAAIHMRHADTASLLLSRGANVESIGFIEDLTALHLAAFRGDVDSARLLVQYGANPNAESKSSGTPLVIASGEDHAELMELLIDAGAKVDALSGTKGETALSAAASRGSWRACKLLLGKNADPDLGGEVLPLLAALRSRSRETVNMQLIELLIENGADPMARNCRQEYPLELAVYRGYEDIVQLFMQHGGTLDARGSRGSILHAAAASQNENMVPFMLGLGAKVAERNDKFGGILQWACPKNYPLLIEQGARVDMVGRRYGSAIQAATVRIDKSGSANVDINGYKVSATEEEICGAVDYLVAAGADVNATGGFHGSAIQAASSRGYLVVVSLLLHHGALINASSGRCGTSLQAAAYHGDVPMVKLLIRKGADVNQEGGLYGTALQAAAFEGMVEVVKLLLQHGADVNMQGGKYGNALAAAKQKTVGQQGLVQQILLSHGAAPDDRDYEYSRIYDSDDYDKNSDAFDCDDDDDENEYRDISREQKSKETLFTISS